MLKILLKVSSAELTLCSRWKTVKVTYSWYKNQEYVTLVTYVTLVFSLVDPTNEDPIANMNM